MLITFFIILSTGTRKKDVDQIVEKHPDKIPVSWRLSQDHRCQWGGYLILISLLLCRSLLSVIMLRRTYQYWTKPSFLFRRMSTSVNWWKLCGKCFIQNLFRRDGDSLYFLTAVVCSCIRHKPSISSLTVAVWWATHVPWKRSTHVKKMKTDICT